MKQMSLQEMNATKGGLKLFSASSGNQSSLIGGTFCLNFGLPSSQTRDTAGTVKF